MIYRTRLRISWGVKCWEGEDEVCVVNKRQENPKVKQSLMQKRKNDGENWRWYWWWWVACEISVYEIK